MGPKLQVWTHPCLPSVRCSGENRELLIVGELIDPREPECSSDGVARGLLNASSSFESFEAETASLGGRWLAFVRFGNDWRVYPDAAGTRSAFYQRDRDGDVWVASQPSLLVQFAGASFNSDIDQRFREPAHRADSWPLALTPYDGVSQLVPNHCLDLRTGTAERFWPRMAFEPVQSATAATLARDILHGSIKAIARRGRAALPITGGYDSRTLLACAGNVRGSIAIVRVTGHHLPFYDELIPRQLARRLGLRLETFRSGPQPDDVTTTMRGNTGGIWWDPADYMLASFRHIPCEYLLLGQISEVARCFYYPDGVHPEDVSPEGAARAAKYGSNPLAIGEFARWLASVPAYSRSHTLDLLYWEHRIGNWAAMLATALDTFFVPVFPFNSRQLLTTLLGVDSTDRRAPYRLHRMICDLAEPRLSRVPFNSSAVDRLVNSHWRLRRAVYGLRRRLSGF